MIKEKTKELPRLKRITLSNFKSIGTEASLNIRPLTIFAGVNSSGKSSFMQPLLLMKQTLESQSDPEGALRMDGPNAHFTTSEQILHKDQKGKQAETFSVRLETDFNHYIEFYFTRELGKGFDISLMRFNVFGHEVSLVPKMNQKDILATIPKLWSVLNFDFNHVKNEPVWKIERNRCFLDVSVSRRKDHEPFEMPRVFSQKYLFSPLLMGLIHLPGLRGNPERNYPKVATGPLFPGRFEQYAASVVSDWQEKKDPRLQILGEQLGKMGLARNVTANKIAETQYELKVGRLPHGNADGKTDVADDMVSIADVGFGVSQTLPVLVALLAAEQGQLVYLEQPEIHLHPNAQRNMAHAFKQAVKRGAITIIETHSSILLREIQTLVAKGELRPEDVALHWFSRGDDGETVVDSAELDEHGAFGAWPVDFDETEMAAEGDYLDAVENRIKQHAERN
jgi:Uncharacterized conserved protein